MLVDFGRVGLVHDDAQVGRRDVVRKTREDGVGHIAVIHAAHGAQVGVAELRIGFRQVEAAVRSETA